MDKMKNTKLGWYDLAGNGGYAITRDLSEEEVIQLNEFADLDTIVPKVDSKPLSNRTWSLLDNHIFSKRPEIGLTISDWAKVGADISFLTLLPSLRCFHFNLPELKTFDGLENLTKDVEELGLSDTFSKKPSLSILHRFNNLKKVNIGNTQKEIEAISTLSNLEKLWIAGATWPDYKCLITLPKLWWVNIVLGGTTNIEHIRYLNSLRYLAMWQVRKLSDISPISSIFSLECLSLGCMRNIKSLPSLKKLKKLRSIYLEKMSELTDLCHCLKRQGLKTS
jgi:hypothetical protein